MKKVFKEAHKMTKEMVEKYGVDYQAQFGLNLSYLLENKEAEKMLKGSEKQVKWANEMLDTINTTLNELEAGSKIVWPESEKNQRAVKSRTDFFREFLNEIKEAADVIDKFKEISYIDNPAKRTEKVLGLINYETQTKESTYKDPRGILFPQALIIYILENAK